jgi:3-epi-6-deoxocathasterone 23-monooxygenase
MVKLVQNVIQARKHSGLSNIPKDVVDVLLNDSSELLTEDLIADNMIDMMIPGEDSVPVLMTLAIKYLSDCPTALQQLTVTFFLLLFNGVIIKTIHVTIMALHILPRSTLSS